MAGEVLLEDIVVPNAVIEESDEEVRKRVLDEFLRGLNRAERLQRSMCDRYARCDRAYHAMYERAAAKPGEVRWESDLRPPYVLANVETLASNFVDEDLTVDILPETPADESGAKAHTEVLRSQLRKDKFVEKQYNFAKQFCIRGLSVGKIPWDYQMLTTYQVDTIEEQDEETGELRQVEVESPKYKILKDQPTFVLVDLYDFMWDPGATSIDDAQEVYHRTWETRESLEQMAQPGPNGEPSVYSNLDKINDKSNRQRYNSNRTSYDGSDLDMSDRVEVIERWRRNRLTVVANRSTVIRDEAMPYLHGKLPFVVASPMPGMFRFDGKSIVELIDDLQRLIWEFKNQSIDNAKLINNAIVLMRTGLADMEKFQAFPGAKWPVDDPSSVQFLRPELSILESAAMMESRAQEDINNITGAIPYLSGAGPTGADTTATEASIISNMAQKRIAMMKQQITYAYARGFEQMVALNQQLINRPLALRLQGPGSGFEWEIVTPDQLTGNFEFYAKPVSESLDRQQKRAEAMSITQFFLSNAPVIMGASQNKVTVNIEEVVKILIDAFGLDANKILSVNEAPVAEAQPAEPTPGDSGPGTPSPERPATNGEASGPVDANRIQGLLAQAGIR